MSLRSSIFCLLLSFPWGAFAGDEPIFRFSLSIEPSSVDPQRPSDFSGGFFLFNLYHGLYRLSPEGVPEPELAELCEWEGKDFKKLRCRLKPDLHFSDGHEINSGHLLGAWQRLIRLKAPGSELLARVKNFAAVMKDQMPLEKLGLEAPDSKTIRIELSAPDPELLYKLSSPVLTPLYGEPPTKPEDFPRAVTTGPYRIESWIKKTRIRLVPNRHFVRPGERPQAEALLVESDTTAFNLYRLGKLSFLRHLPIKELVRYRSNPELLYSPVYRFDYVGFGPALKNQPELRQALTLSLNYDELTKAFLTPGRFGCPAIPEKWASPWPCLKFDPKRAQKLFSHLPLSVQKKALQFAYVEAGIEDVARSLEWMQAQWKKNLGIQVELKPMELGMMTKLLQSSPPDLFRRGVNLDRPTCTAALENFHSLSPENFVALKLPAFDTLVDRLARTTDKREKERICGQGLKLLFDQDLFIPLGELYLRRLAKPEFIGWRITPLNQLDLTDLRAKRL